MDLKICKKDKAKVSNKKKKNWKENLQNKKRKLSSKLRQKRKNNIRLSKKNHLKSRQNQNKQIIDLVFVKSLIQLKFISGKP
jgi:hypothetical protein